MSSKFLKIKFGEEKRIRRRREKNLIGSSSARSSGKEDGWLGDARTGSVPFEGASRRSNARILLGLKLIPLKRGREIVQEQRWLKTRARVRSS